MTGTPFTLTTRNIDADRTQVSIAGELDEITSASLHDLWNDLLRPNHTVELDLTEVTFFNSTAVAVLMRGFQQASSTGSTISITSASPVVRRVLGICGLTHLITTPDAG